MATIQEMLQSAQYKFGQGPDNVRFGDDFYSAINDAQQQIAITRKWGFLRTSTTLVATINTRTISLPSNFGTPFNERGAIRITTSGYSGDVIQLIPPDEWYNDEYEDGSDTGEPAFAYIMGGSLYLSPIPDAAYTIHFPYYKLPAQIDESSDSITVPTQYHELLKKMIWRRLQDNGYSSIQEISISDMDISVLMNRAARDDIAKYGGVTFNLTSTDYTRKTI